MDASRTAATTVATVATVTTVSTATTATEDWDLWSTTARLVVTDPAALAEARRIADAVLERVELASSRFRPDSEILTKAPLFPVGALVSDTLAELMRLALAAAAETDGDVDPTLGNALGAIGYDHDIRLILDDGVPVRAIASPRPGWASVRLVGNRLTVPAHLGIDLGATVKAAAADLVAEQITAELGCGVLVSLGGDIASAGPGPAGGWQVLVQDAPLDPSAHVTLAAGLALATSSTQKRRWTKAGRPQHHILDPASGLPAEPGRPDTGRTCRSRTPCSPRRPTPCRSTPARRSPSSTGSGRRRAAPAPRRPGSGDVGSEA